MTRPDVADQDRAGPPNGGPAPVSGRSAGADDRPDPVGRVGEDVDDLTGLVGGEAAPPPSAAHIATERVDRPLEVGIGRRLAPSPRLVTADRGGRRAGLPGR